MAERNRGKETNIWVYDDGAIKGFIWAEIREVKKLFVEPVLQGNSIGSCLLQFAVETLETDSLWALEKNIRAIAFYERHGFCASGERKPVEGTTEYLIRMTK